MEIEKENNTVQSLEDISVIKKNELTEIYNIRKINSCNRFFMHHS